MSSEEQVMKMENRNDGCSNGVVKWEKFLHKMQLRVLLVEADDSTRQIIAALLRKCNYRVAAIGDGLKAWEILKGRPHDIDLILTEVELPSISGFALLTLITEHEICKNIPVIMMSSNDSVSMVYKCMLRGAADFLVKPVRRNELRNLWQHFWRRKSSIGVRQSSQDETMATQKVEAISENNAASNHSLASGYMAGIAGENNCVEIGSDSQSSCTKPDLEAQSAYTESLTQPKWNQAEDHLINLGSGSKDGDAMNQIEEVEPKNHVEVSHPINEPSVKEPSVKSPREAIDLIAAFNNNSKCSYSCSEIGTNKFDSHPQLDLSLKRSHSTSPETQVNNERPVLNHSDLSAFSRYIHQPLQPHMSTRNVSNQQKECGTNFDLTLPCPQQRVYPVQVPVKGIRFNNLPSGYGSILPPVFCTQSGPSPTPSPSSVDQNAKNSTNQEQPKLDSSTTEQSTNSSFCNGAINSVGSLSICGIDGSGNGKNEDLFARDGSSQRSLREAALNKFRMKRKDRCYEKKVRYESRKKLAEQRPRVKGQFVRQVQNDAFHADNGCGSSFDS